MAADPRIQAGSYRANMAENLTDPVSGELMTRAVTLIPCGHVFNEDTIIQCIARNNLCPLDRARIERHIPNYNIRHLASTTESQPDEEPTPEAQSRFAHGKQLADAGNYEAAITALLGALQLSPMYGKAQAYLDFSLNKASSQGQAGPAEARSLPPQSLPTRLPTVGTLLTKILDLLNKQDVKADKDLTRVLESKAGTLMALDGDTPVSPADKVFYENTVRLMDESGRIITIVAKYFTGALPTTPVAAPAAAVRYQEPEIAFGKAKWERYFGDVGAEPPLPPNINTILASQSPFNPNQTVAETHLLVLVPQTVNGQPLTLKSLGELIQKPKTGNKAQYRPSNFGGHENTPAPKSHWVLMTRDVLEGSRAKSFEDQKKLLKPPYEVPSLLEAAVSILMHHVETREHLYPENPRWTYTRCAEKHSSGSWQMVVGGFAPAGLDVHGNSGDNDLYGLGAIRKF